MNILENLKGVENFLNLSQLPLYEQLYMPWKFILSAGKHYLEEALMMVVEEPVAVGVVHQL